MFSKVVNARCHPSTPALAIHGLHNMRRWEVYAGAKGDVAPYVWEFNLIINCTGTKLPNHRVNLIPPGTGISPCWTSPVRDREMVIDWPDFKTPDMPIQFWQMLLLTVQKKRRVLVFCGAGHGRTGTCLSLLWMIANEIPGTQAINEVRKLYCHEAVETLQQTEYIMRVGELLGYGKGDK